jgi:hypothetical protein
MDRNNHEVMTTRIPRELARTIRRKARAEDRTVAGYIRRVLVAATASVERQQLTAPADVTEQTQ